MQILMTNSHHQIEEFSEIRGNNIIGLGCLASTCHSGSGSKEVHHSLDGVSGR